MNQREMLLFDRKTDKIRPPADHDPSNSKIIQGRPVLMVRYDANDRRSCVRCLALQTEFFFYEFKGDQFGYVWMRLIYDALLTPCIAQHSCTELWYDRKVEQLVISDDNRPFSFVGIGDTNNKNFN